MSTKPSALCLVLLTAFAVSGCSKDDDENGDQKTARLRVVHASPDAPAVDIYAAGNATPLFTNVTYAQTTEYLGLTPGTYDIQVRSTGAAADSTPAFSTGTIEVPESASITAVAAGLLGSTAEADSFRILLLPEQFAGPGAGEAQARFVHAAADAPAVLLDVGDDGTTELGPIARFEATPAEGFALSAGQTLQLAVLAGSPSAKVTAFTTPQLQQGSAYFLVATGLLDRPPREDDAFSLLVVGPAGTVGRVEQNPTLYALHASPDAPAVDLFTGDLQLVEDLSFGQLSAPIQVVPGTYPIDFFATEAGETRPTGAPAASATTPTLEAGQQYLAVASGFLASGRTPAFQLLAFQDGFDLTTPEQARLRAVHASPETPAVDVGSVSSGTFTQLVPDLSFGEASPAEGLALAPAAYVIGLAPAGTTTAAAQFPLTLEAGARVFGVAAGLLTPSASEPPVQLLVVETSTSPWAVTSVANQP
jgi:hypothetical protein